MINKLSNNRKNGRLNKKKSKKRKKLMKLCGLHDYSNTSHCFSDSTHHTCCLLGPDARRFADSRGNPIGNASEKAYNLKNKKTRKDNLRPWCTCIGSDVCSYYADTFKDGTKIKFINDIKSNDKVYKGVGNYCEDDVRQKMKLHKHLTPGVAVENRQCKDVKNIKKVKISNFSKKKRKKNRI